MLSPPISWSAGDYLILSMLWRVFFCQALKHSGRLIKSVPQAAAPIGSHTEKYSPSLSYITRKMRGHFEVHQSCFLFFCWLPPRRQLVPGCWSCSHKRRNKKRLILTVQLPKVCCLSGCALLHPHLCCFPTSSCYTRLKCFISCLYFKNRSISHPYRTDSVIFPLIHQHRCDCSANVSSSLQVRAWAFPVLARAHLMVCCWQTMAESFGVKRSGAVTSHSNPAALTGHFSTLFNL